MASNDIKRKLTAILAADVVGYSRLVGADEEDTLSRLRALRGALIDPTVIRHNGRIVKSTGDGAIVEFRSIVDATRCALEMQNDMAAHNAELPAERRMEFRIGVHIGDVVEEADGDLMGDGVNVASRLEGVAKPGGVCLSEDAYRLVKAKLDLKAEDLGPIKLKNIAEPMRAFLVGAGETNAKPSGATSTAPALPERPSIAVLPFQNMSGDPEQEYFADGMVEDIITGLSRIKWLFVIARNSSFIYKGKAVDVRQAGRELGVRYVLEGSVRKAGNRVRITGQLIEAETGTHLWADRYDGALEDVFDLQDQITDRVVGVVEPSLRQSEIERSRRKRPDSLDAYDLYLRALAHVTLLHPAEVRTAKALLEEALKLDPNYAAAHALVARCHEMGYMAGGFDEAEKAAALRHSHAVIAAGADDPTALTIAAAVIAQLERDFETASRALDRALSLNPSSATAHFFGARICACRGDTAGATAHAQRALRLSPFDRMAYESYGTLGVVAFYQDRYDDAAAHFAQAAQIVGFSSFYIAQAIALALAGRMDESGSALARGLALEPNFRLRLFAEFGLEQSVVDKIVAGGRLLGLPE
jgi:TolB-like protein/class 3 adenylate cyclase/Tfp pilus assembly protein PilF